MPAPHDISRRALLTAASAAAVPADTPEVDRAILERHDQYVERLLETQVTDPASRWRGAIPDEFGIHQPHSAAGILDACTAAFLHPRSKFHKSNLLVERMRLAADHLRRAQNDYGNIDLLITNFNSPPDTAFVVHNVGTAACLAKRHGARELLKLSEGFLEKAGRALAAGGVHTPNHRWVVCAALAQIHELFPKPEYVRRIGQWLAEGIDIDADGQYSERSTSVYNPITDRALIVVAAKLNRPELLDPVRRNLASMLYLLHPGYEVVTEISRRQDQNQRADMGRYWFSLRYLAVQDNNGQYAALADHFAARYAGLSALMEYPELARRGPAHAALPDDYEKQFPTLAMARIRRGFTSATVLLNSHSRFFTLRRSDAVVNAVRFAAAFFGKAQFLAQQATRDGASYHLTQQLDGPYYQPLGRKIGARHEDWVASRAERRPTEVCRLEQSATVTELPNGFRLRIRSHGTRDVPVAVEINFREGGKLLGCEPVPRVSDAWLLASGHAVYEAAGQRIRFGPGAGAHAYTHVRGAEPKLPGPSVYLTGYTPFDHTFEFSWD